MILCMYRFLSAFYTMSFLFQLSLFIFLLSFLAFFYPNKLIYKITESSVWCEGKSCRFKNICYDSDYKSFLFFLNENSVIKGIDRYDALQKIRLSSINHNRFYANITMIHPLFYRNKKNIEIVKKGILISRFKPDNIMHCIHDDLFPLFLTLEKNCMGDVENCIEILLHDDHPKEKYFELYERFAKIIFLTDHFNSLLCFEEVIAGLSQESLFFQYGFDKPHGPINATGITQNDVSRFTSFIRKGIKEDYKKTDIIFLSRKKTRRILNENYVIETVQNFYEKHFSKKNSSFIIADLNSNSIKFLISKILKADLLVGMHGAEMILSMFLKPNSVVIELFPYGIRENISFLKSLTNIVGNNQTYISWRNFEKNNSVPNPDAHPLFGGIKHLPKDLQNEIKNIKEVPAVRCCDDPAYLYYMYHDTFVGDDFEIVLNNSKFKNNTKNNFLKWFFPSIVSDLMCKYHEKSLLISWSPPFNIKNSDQIIYSIFLAGEKMNFKKEIKTKETFLNVEIDSDEKKFKFWISVHFLENESASADQLYECK